jgi:hypothetical protein
MDGQHVDMGEPIWKIRSSADGGMIITIRLDRWSHLALSSRARRIAELYFVDRIARKKARTVEHDYKTIRRFDRWLFQRWRSPSIRKTRFNWSDLDETIARAFLSHGISKTASKGNDFARLREFYRWGFAHQYRDFSLQTLMDLKSVRAIGNLKGHNVRFHHPVKGPLSPDELLLVSNACAQGKGSERDRALVLLHLELGINPNSTVRIKNRDFKSYIANGISTFQIDVPRLKKRTAVRETTRRNITAKLGSLIQSLQGKASVPDAPLFYWLNTSRPEGDVNRAMLRFVNEAQIISPRTGESLRLTPRRCTTTLATHMAEEGASRFHIAEILDHTDLQNVSVYTETVSSIADDVARATDRAMGSLVNRFLGKIVDSLDSAPRQQLIPMHSPHIPLPVLNLAGIGGCGKDIVRDGLCELFPPLSCYLCPSFAALRSGPHREMLDSLESYVTKNKGDLDSRILGQLNDIILAVRTVLKRLG